MYETFRNNTLKAQTRSQLPLRHLAVSHPPPPGHHEALSTDYFYTPEKKDRCLIHISGVHGVEGYLGSIIQQKIFQELPAELPFQLILVHAVNPHGMARFRRTNPQNVDLNRNSLTKFEIHNPAFKSFLPFLQSGKATDFLKTLPMIVKLGFKETVQTVACGQTDFPNSLFYAGHELQPELVSLRDTLHTLVNPKAHLYILDVHTGLGKMAKESLLLDGYGSLDEAEFFKQAFQSSLIWPDRTAGFYKSAGVISQLFKNEWQAFHLIQEFGTYPFYKVLNALIHQQPEQMLEAFYPNKDLWRNRCIDIGLLRFRQLVQTLS